MNKVYCFDCKHKRVDWHNGYEDICKRNTKIEENYRLKKTAMLPCDQYNIDNDCQDYQPTIRKRVSQFFSKE